MALIDYSQPISVLLKGCTRQAHEDIEHSDGAITLSKGELTKEEYVRFLIMLWHVYSAFEEALERHSSNPVLEPTYDPPLLARASALSADIAYLLDVPETSWQRHPVYTSFVASPPTAMQNYVSRIRTIADSQDPLRLLSHSYVRYLGDLSGGQSIKRVLAKAYGLDESSGSGLSFFAFRELKSAKPASQGEMKRIKEWFREGMNKGVGDDIKTKEVVIDEANVVFRLNKGLFDTIDASHRKDAGTLPDLGNIVSNLPQPANVEDGGYSVASVATVILAVGIAHFILVVGGFTGNRGYGKLVGFYEWIDHLWKAMTLSA